jgi:paraquat-inducible protein A
VVPGPALWAFMALTVMLTAVLSFNPGAFWEMTFRPKDEPKAEEDGASA